MRSRVLLLAFAVSLSGSASGRAEMYLIQPGAEAITGHTPLGPLTGCTLNFVFADDAATYIGATARCTERLHEPARTPAGDVFGTVVFRAFTGTEGASELATQTPIDDIALIRIHPEFLSQVSPVVRGWGSAPAGHTTSGTTADGAQLQMYGQGIVHKQGGVTQRRYGTLATDDDRTFWSSFVATPGDSGAPVMHVADGRALGVLSVNGAPYSRGTTVERILQVVRAAGFDVDLVTG